MRIGFLLAPVAMACAYSNSAHAHHGRDFLLVQTAHLPERGSGYVITRLDWLSEATNESEFEPAVLYGVTDRVAVEAHAHYEKPEGEPSRFESVAPAVHFRFTDKERPFSVGLSLEYELAHHSEDDDVLATAVLFGYEMNDWIVAGNILNERRSGATSEWGYAAGIRRTFAQKHGLGIEFLGSFESEGSSEMMVGYYREFSEQFTFNAGVGTGIDHGPDESLRTAFIWRFR